MFVQTSGAGRRTRSCIAMERGARSPCTKVIKAPHSAPISSFSFSACYGIVNVPTGPWFCRKCESQERAVRVKCELCPSKDGALKRTDNNGWAHVVCALYIPEVRFGNVTTMEPIILQLIPQERFNRVRLKLCPRL